MEISFTKMSALWIKDGKVLVVRGTGDNFFKALGGKIDPDETDEDCLRREIKEECMCDLVSSEFLIEYKEQPTHNEPRRYFDVRFYVVDVQGEPQINPEDKTEEFLWLGKAEYENANHELTGTLQDEILPLLMEKGLVY